LLRHTLVIRAKGEVHNGRMQGPRFFLSVKRLIVLTRHATFVTLLGSQLWGDIQTYNGLKVRFSATAGDNPKIELAEG
jgi:hypothetical protein